MSLAPTPAVRESATVVSAAAGGCLAAGYFGLRLRISVCKWGGGRDVILHMPHPVAIFFSNK